MTIYPDVPPRPVLQIAMPRAPRIYATGTPSELITLHPSYLALSRYAKVRQRHYRNLLSPGPDPVLIVAMPAGPPSGLSGAVSF